MSSRKGARGPGFQLHHDGLLLLVPWAINSAHSMAQALAPAPGSTPASASAPAAGVAADEFDVLRPACDRTCKCCCNVANNNKKATNKKSREMRVRSNA